MIAGGVEVAVLVCCMVDVMVVLGVGNDKQLQAEDILEAANVLKYGGIGGRSRASSCASLINGSGDLFRMGPVVVDVIVIVLVAVIV
ncbi:hypothetical protein EAF00_005415 [Botryotinia globosa]|nr:hypothetical protein EAF00_005415 [Botryotinia globosa]